MNVNPVFIPVQAKEAIIKTADFEPGSLYFATDTGKMYLDTNDNRISVGGAGAAIYYSNGEATEEEDYWLIDKNSLSNSNDAPAVKDILLNEQDGCFYRVESIGVNHFTCTRIAISGSGDGSGTPTQKIPSLFFSKDAEK